MSEPEAVVPPVSSDRATFHTEAPLTDTAAEAAMRTILDAAFAEDGETFANGLTSLAYVDLLHIMREVGEIPRMEGYSVSGHEPEGKDHGFLVRFIVPDRPIELGITMSVVKGNWKIARLKMPGVRE